MQTFMFITREEIAAEGMANDRDRSWSCGSQLRRGDRVLVYVVKRGVRFEWRATSDAQRGVGESWRFTCDLKVVKSFKPPITIAELRAMIPQSVWSPPHQNFRGYQHIAVPSSVFNQIKGMRPAGTKPLPAMLFEFEENVRKAMSRTSKQRMKRLQNAERIPKTTKATTTVFIRNCDVVAEVLHRAKGKCGICKKQAPFRRHNTGTPYLEVHHRVQLALGGEDTIENAIAACPNCHRRAHFGTPMRKNA